MAELDVLYRDVDRSPYLYTLRHCARRYGVDLQLRRLDPAMLPAGASGEDWGRLLEDGEVDVIAENYWGLVSFAARCAPFSTVASAVHRWDEHLLVAPGVHAVEELSGGRFAVRDTGPQRLFPELWLTDLGLVDEVEQVLVSQHETGRWGHWKAVVSGGCHACFVSPLYAAPAFDAGLRELPWSGYAFEGGNVTLTTTEEVVARRGTAVQGLVDAAFDTHQLFHEDRATVLAIVENECADLLAEHFAIGSDTSLEQLYELLRAELAASPVPTADGIRTAQRLRARSSPELAEFNPLLMWDLSFARQAWRSRAERRT